MSQPDAQFAREVDELRKKYVSPAVYGKGISWLKKSVTRMAADAEFELEFGERDSVAKVMKSVRDLAPTTPAQEAARDRMIQFVKDHMRNDDLQQPSEIIHKPDEREAQFGYKQELRDQINKEKGDGSGSLAVPITDEEIKFRKSYDEGMQLNDFHQWIHTRFDWRDPIVKDWLEKTYPDFFKWKKATIERDQEISYQRKMLETFGPKSMKDLLMQYMLDMGVVKTSEELAAPEEEAAKNAFSFTRGGRYGPPIDSESGMRRQKLTTGVIGNQARKNIFQKIASVFIGGTQKPTDVTTGSRSAKWPEDNAF